MRDEVDKGLVCEEMILFLSELVFLLKDEYYIYMSVCMCVFVCMCGHEDMCAQITNDNFQHCINNKFLFKKPVAASERRLGL